MTTVGWIVTKTFQASTSRKARLIMEGNQLLSGWYSHRLKYRLSIDLRNFKHEPGG